MDRRTLIVAAGFGTGLTGCLDRPLNGGGGGNESSDGSEGLSSEASNDGGAESDGATDDTGSKQEKSADDAEPGTDSSNDETDAEAGDPDDDSGRDVRFDSCTRATVTGTFEAGDVAFANTGFYDEGLFGDTLLEDGVTFGEDVAAPFSGTVVFEIGDESRVHASGDEIVVEIADYGSDGTVITSLTTRQSDYLRVSATHENPRADACLGEIEAGSDGNDGGDDASVAVDSLETNTPLDAGRYLEVRATVRNAGGSTATRELRLVVGHTPERVDARSVSLDPGESTTVRLGYETPPVDSDQEFPVRVEAGDDAATRSVLVYGTG